MNNSCLHFYLATTIASGFFVSSRLHAEDPGKDEVKITEHFKSLRKDGSYHVTDEKELAHLVTGAYEVYGSGFIVNAFAKANKPKPKKVMGVGGGLFLAIDGAGRFYAATNDLDPGVAPIIGVSGWTIREINEVFEDLPANYADLLKSLKGQHSENKEKDGVTIDDYFRQLQADEKSVKTLIGSGLEAGAGSFLSVKTFKNMKEAQGIFKKAKSVTKLGVGIYAIADGASRVIAHIEDLDGGLSPAAASMAYLIDKSKESLGMTPKATLEPRPSKVEKALGDIKDSLIGNANSLGSDIEKTLKGKQN